MSQLTLLNLSQPVEPTKIKASAPPSIFTLDNPNEYFAIFDGMKTASGKSITYDMAMRCSAVLCCIRILSEDIASLPRVLKRRTPAGAEDATDHPAYRLLKFAPNEFQTAFEMTESMMLDLLLTGYFFNWQKRNGVGRLTEIVPIPARSMAYSRQLPDGTLIWTCGQPGFPNQFAHWDLWRGNILNWNVIGGRSLILLAREAVGLALAAEEQGARLFSNGVQTDLVLEAEGDFGGADAKDQLRDALAARHGGSANAFMPILLENGLKAKRIGLTAVESQYIESRHYSLADIARLFRVPGVLLGLADKTNTFAAAESFFQGYSKHTLGPWTRRIEETAERDLLLSRESDLFVRHDYTQLLRSDQKTRFEAYKVAIEAGIMQPQEARKTEEWNEVKGLDYTMIPVNYAVMRDGVMEGVPTDRSGPQPPEDLPATPGQPNTEPPATAPQPAPNSADKLAQRAGALIIRSEQRQFARMRVSEAASANFAAWHLEKVMEVTGTDVESAQEYSAWRLDNRTDHALALEKIVNLCLEASL